MKLHSIRSLNNLLKLNSFNLSKESQNNNKKISIVFYLVFILKYKIPIKFFISK